MKNGMSTIEYVKRKNKLVEDQFGHILVPEDQIKEVTKNKLSMVDDMNACPYCIIYYVGGLDYERCKGCPMQEAGNGCLMNAPSTYGTVTDAIDTITKTSSSIIATDGLSELIDEFNESNGFSGFSEKRSFDV